MKEELLYILMGLFLFSSCGNDTDPLPEINYGYEYFPLSGVSSKEYKIIEERYSGTSIDTNVYYLKEEFSEALVVSDETQQVVNRYKKENLLDEWSFDSLWVLARNEEFAFSIENNLRLVKLQFPLAEGIEWDRNDYNINNELLITLESLDKNNELLGYTDENTAKVSIETFTSFVNTDVQYEIYAKNIGLINQYSEHLNHQPGKDTVGTRVEYILTAYEVN